MASTPWQHDDDVRACVVPADLAVNLDMISDMSEPVAQAYLNALALCETEGVATLWVHVATEFGGVAARITRQDSLKA